MTHAADESLIDPFGWVGSTIDGKYRVDAVVGEGGFGVVYAAQHLGFDERIAIKCLRLDDAVPGSKRSQFVKSFVAEGRIMYRLAQASPAIVRAIDVGASVSPSGIWTPYLVLEWVSGGTLEQELRARIASGAPARTIAEALELLEPAARALDAVHEKGIAHRDIKPGNLLVTDVRGRRTIKVVDFGIAKVMSDVAKTQVAAATTGTSIRAFSPPYGAPEQFDSRVGGTGPWTDVFALALVVVEVVAGRRALHGDEVTQLYLQATDQSRRPTLRGLGFATSDDVERVLQRALAVDPRNRFARAGAFWDALVAASRPQSASQAALPYARTEVAPVAQASDDVRGMRTEPWRTEVPPTETSPPRELRVGLSVPTTDAPFGAPLPRGSSPSGNSATPRTQFESPYSGPKRASHSLRWALAIVSAAALALATALGIYVVHATKDDNGGGAASSPTDSNARALPSSAGARSSALSPSAATPSATPSASAPFPTPPQVSSAKPCCGGTRCENPELTMTKRLEYRCPASGPCACPSGVDYVANGCITTPWGNFLELSLAKVADNSDPAPFKSACGTLLRGGSVCVRRVGTTSWTECAAITSACAADGRPVVGGAQFTSGPLIVPIDAIWKKKNGPPGLELAVFDAHRTQVARLDATYEKGFYAIAECEGLTFTNHSGGDVRGVTLYVRQRLTR